MFESKTKVDFSARENYEQTFMERVFEAHVNSGTYSEAQLVLQMQEMEMQDEIWNPFNTTTDYREFLQVSQILTSQAKDKYLVYDIEFRIDN